MKMGERIAKLRKEKGMSQEKLAEALGLSRQAVAKWETGQSFPSSGNLFKLAEVLGTDVDALLKGELESPPAPSDDFAEVKKDLRKRLLAAGAVAGAYLLYYLLGRLPIGFSGYSVVGWLTESSPLVLPYLYGWSAGLVWFVFLLSLGAALGKKYRFASAVTGGAFYRLPAGRMVRGPSGGNLSLPQPHRLGRLDCGRPLFGGDGGGLAEKGLAGAVKGFCPLGRGAGRGLGRPSPAAPIFCLTRPFRYKMTKNGQNSLAKLFWCLARTALYKAGKICYNHFRIILNTSCDPKRRRIFRWI